MLGKTIINSATYFFKTYISRTIYFKNFLIEIFKEDTSRGGDGKKLTIISESWKKGRIFIAELITIWWG